jgi:UDP-N-acetylglucosamine 2-epimerase
MPLAGIWFDDDDPRSSLVVRIDNEAARRHTRPIASSPLEHATDVHLVCLAPQPYLDALSLVAGVRVVLTDSGGLPEEGRWRVREDQPIPL